jgi:nitrogen fixation protein NifU and related proteins
MQYSKKLIEHFTKPHNQGTIKNPSGVGIVGNPICGDLMKIYIKIEKDKRKKEYIKDIKFETLGCASAIATSSMITDLAKGKSLGEAMQITKNNVADALDGLPPSKIHCSNLADEGLHAAIQDYQNKKKK